MKYSHTLKDGVSKRKKQNGNRLCLKSSSILPLIKQPLFRASQKQN